MPNQGMEEVPFGTFRTMPHIPQERLTCMSPVIESDRAADTAKLTVHFVRSLQEVLTTMAGTKVTVGRPSYKTDPGSTHDVSGIIGFSGDFIGSMVLTFKEATAVAIVKAFAGAELSLGSTDFTDAIGELANMIAGSAKKAFGGTNISLPTVVIGHGHLIGRLNDVPCILIPCDSASGSFAVEVNIKSIGSQA